MLPVERIIGEEGLRAQNGELHLAVRLPWYRSLPFSTVEFDSLTIDGVAVPLDDAILEYDGARWPLAQNGEQVDTFWFVRDSAYLVWPAAAAQPGDEHDIALTININPPYIPGMKRANSQTMLLRIDS